MADETKPALVALRDRREEVIRILSDGYANDVLPEAAFEERVMRAHEATRIATLDALVADLTLDHDPPPTALAPTTPPTTMDAVHVPVVARRPQALRAIFSSIERRGAWEVPRELAVQCEGSALFASFEHRGPGAVADPERPLLRIVGGAVFGSIEIKVRPPSGFIARVRHALGMKPRAALPARRGEKS